MQHLDNWTTATMVQKGKAMLIRSLIVGLDVRVKSDTVTCPVSHGALPVLPFPHHALALLNEIMSTPSMLW